MQRLPGLCPIVQLYIHRNGGANQTIAYGECEKTVNFDIPAHQGFESLQKNYKILKSHKP
jgi:hypothetical protein